MQGMEHINVQPLAADYTVRTTELRAITSCRAGQIVPLHVQPLFRMDSIQRGRYRVRVEAMPLAKTLLNAINVTYYVHFVPYLAFDRHMDMGSLNRSYMGVPETKGGAVVPFFKTMKYKREAAFWATLGLHYKQDADVNSAYVEAYNELVNWRCRARSEKLPQRGLLDTTLAPAFWATPGMQNIVSSFDQAMADGEVLLRFAQNRIPVKGIGIRSEGMAKSGAKTSNETDATKARAYAKGWNVGEGQKDQHLIIKESDAHPGFPDIYAEMAQGGVTLSLSNIDLAKKTAAFARLRKDYEGLDDDHIIDLLMSGVEVPEELMRQPILLDKKTTIVGMSKRNATDAANLAKSITTGETFVDLQFRMPKSNTGGILLITMEIVPEQLFERQCDPFLRVTNPDELPKFDRDYLDPEPVEIVRNIEIDTEHSKPNGTFGYRPLNRKWEVSAPRIGGKFMRPLKDGFNEDRQRFWAVEVKDPSLTKDFWIVNELPHSVFQDTKAHAFEVTTLGTTDIVGITVMGKSLEEGSDDYSIVMSGVDTSRIGQA
ncbi:major capsid protein [Tortoise microvirus 37]|nr:major capsid protein [Tortoise microvirus 37]